MCATRCSNLIELAKYDACGICFQFSQQCLLYCVVAACECFIDISSGDQLFPQRIAGAECGDPVRRVTLFDIFEERRVLRQMIACKVAADNAMLLFMNTREQICPAGGILADGIADTVPAIDGTIGHCC